MTKQRVPLPILLVLSLFFGVMGLVTVVAYSRHTGNTGQDMAKVKLQHAPKPDLVGNE